MKAVGYKKPLPISDPESLLDIEVPKPMVNGRDLLIEVKAISVNPVDVKVRASTSPQGTEHKILGMTLLAWWSQQALNASFLAKAMMFFMPALSPATERMQNFT